MSTQKPSIMLGGEELLTPREAADRVGMTPDTIRRWVKLGLLPMAMRYGLQGRYYRVRASDLEALIIKQEVN